VEESSTPTVTVKFDPYIVLILKLIGDSRAFKPLAQSPKVEYQTEKKIKMRAACTYIHIYIPHAKWRRTTEAQKHK